MSTLSGDWGLSPAKAALLAARVAARRDAPAPLSFGQERLWLVDRLAGGTAAYNVARVLRVEGPLDLELLGRALTRVVERHEVLRSRVGLVDAAPVSTVFPAEPVPVEVHRATDPAEVRELVRALATRPFDLGRDQLLRAGAVETGPQRWTVCLVTHHVASDESSRGVLFTELAAHYAALRQGREADLAPLRHQYADVARRQRAAAGRPDGELSRWWADTLAGAPARVALPWTAARTGEATLEGARTTVTLPAHGVAALLGVGRAAGASPFMTFLAGYAGWLARYGDTPAVVVGTPVSMRSGEADAGLIGYFSNMLAVPVDVAASPSLRTLLGRTREVVAGALAHSAMPFERLVHELAPPRESGAHPVFQVAFAVEENTGTAPDLDGLAVEAEDVDLGVAKFDLTLVVRPGEQDWSLMLEHATDVLDGPTAEALAGQLRAFLLAAAADPDCPLDRLPLLDPVQEQALRELGTGPWPEQPPALLVDRVLAVAAGTPHAPAVVAGDERLTYAELVGRAGAVAEALREAGAGPGSRVAVCVRRTAGLPVALLAVHLLGAAYVPVDPGYPVDRVRHMLDDADVRVVVTSGDLVGPLSALLVGRTPVLVDGPAPGSGDRLPAAPAPDPGAVAYVIYTSGSTGRPKGVAVSQGALANFLDSMAREPGLGPQDRLLAVTTVSFDIAALELLGPLLVGGTVVVADDDATADPARLAALMEQHEVTVLQATPATWRLLVDGGWPGRAGLRALCGGEALPPSLAEELLVRTGELWNMYGPTETTVWSALHQVREVDGSVPLGRPVARTTLTVVDRALQPVPPTMPGELVIGGAGLAVGYHGQPGLTAEKFVTGPDGARVYRTGDLVRRDLDGSLRFLGRLDHQVKVRGFRVELGDVESALLAAPGVAEAVVVLSSAVGSGDVLVGYVAPAEPSVVVDVAAVRATAAAALPAYMVPGAVVVLPALPRTPNGKVDRAALPVPSRDALAAGSSAYVAPRTPVEELLAEIWAQVLEVDRVGVHDDVFHLGGHSLSLVRIAARVRVELGVEIALRSVYDAPTVEAMAAAVAQTLLAEDGEDLDALLAGAEADAGDGAASWR